MMVYQRIQPQSRHILVKANGALLLRDIFWDCSESILERVPGLTEWMDWIDCRGLKKAAVTNAPAENARVMLAALGMDKWFDEIILGENCKMPKPHPDPYLDAIKVLGVQRDEALICEDSPSGRPFTILRPLRCPHYQTCFHQRPALKRANIP